ncbi:FtsZ family protein CetZ, type III [Natronomonas pharaonis DSM 2160]|uniref:Tubulin-like protein CetZ n=1 Tax=Natronomonas pharaonis (strain ATCC 35678 / DSM 2160 / CIP 103997 / JCM 8858 / NBRC 14720 / NCIMB 2260 / Gabara) TaxID=348780 RepID=Q3IRF0_NATPD|nr:tubulin/FtsZ family protein [Natronomonas pharaonis]CAI49293.1 FtsZ family protein CetZ, type III [Natronomonas pharaonis DSM 2160]
MKLAMIGFGQAGGKILDRFLEYDSTRGTGIVGHAVAVNSAKADLMGLDYVPNENRVLIGQSVVKGHGAGTEPELGERCAKEDMEEIQSAIDRMVSSEIDAFLVMAGLGGGTGSGGAPVLAEHLQRLYVEPVYGLGILPARDEGGIYNRNAARSFQRFAEAVDNLLTFDNDAFKTGGESLGEGYAEINAEIITRFGALFSAGEVEALGDNVAESVVDASEIINTLGEHGISSVGYASEPVQTKQQSSGLLDRLRGGNDKNGFSSGGDATNRITSLVRKATLGKLTLQCEVDSTERVLLLVSGPPEALNRKGIDKARKWLESQTDCMEVRAGDYPLPNEDKVAAIVVLSGVTDVPRVKEMQRMAVEAEEKVEEIRSQSKDDLDDLIEYGDDETQ